ncbi:PAAR domain-containing protein [Pseudoduganella ginsengisoli]|uniref:PAAR domain-containing protein n=1 Tax=Pseudoduganella ginsengisoli TaxID=1462440 RepID=A0A6L6Q843_9BURK|nr:PAAR domain-containing protein [Pseudoduganella ginsengisoli]MTW05619.1 PAAR domain-containing protein [Pseudoduganella ginsengisoli]
MGKAIIRQGDRTSHGGIVKEGFSHAILFGKPIAGRGHKVYCPLCKGDFPIIEGTNNHFFGAIGTAVEGMKTACGATLIASQHAATIDVSSSAANHQSKHTSDPALSTHSAPQQLSFDDKYVLIDEDSGTPLQATEYAIRRANGDLEFGITDAVGHTHLLSATAQAESVDIYI